MLLNGFMSKSYKSICVVKTITIAVSRVFFSERIKQLTIKSNTANKQIYKTEDNLVSDWTKSIGKAAKECPKLPLEDLDPRIHLIDERNSEKDKQHLTHPSTAA